MRGKFPGEADTEKSIDRERCGNQEIGKIPGIDGSKYTGETQKSRDRGATENCQFKIHRRDAVSCLVRYPIAYSCSAHTGFVKALVRDRKSTPLNSIHQIISY